MKQLTTIFAITILILTACQNSNEQTRQKINGMTYPVKNISISINKPVNEVYEFASNPENFPIWVEFIKSMTKQTKNNWLAETDLGNIEIEFVPKNEFGIIDHLVTLPDSSTVNNPMRVIENGKGSELVFTLFWMPNRTEEEFNQDAKLVENDLKKIKRILETE
jgi:hypothetical protein